MRFNSLAHLLIVSSIALLFQATPAFGLTGRRVTKLAEGVYEIEHPGEPYPSGNTTVIIGDRQVFVVDSCFRPSAAREDIAQIRQWTDKPVSFVLNTHFHNDHNLGNRAYMDAFPALTIIAHVETKKEIDIFGPGSLSRVEKGTAYLQSMLDTGKTRDGRQLTAQEKTEVRKALAGRLPVMEELKQVKFQSATLTFDHDFSIDIGNREVQIKFLGRGNTAGDAVVYLPREKIVIAGDLVVHPIPFIYGGYPCEWIQTLQKLALLNADTIVPGHGRILRDKSHIFLTIDLLKSAVDQLTAKLRQSGPAMSQSLDDVKAAIDLSAFRQRFAGNDKDLIAEFDEMAANLVKVAFHEASLR